MACLARAWPSWHVDGWLVDSTPVECGRSRETPKRSDTRRMGLLRLQRLALTATIWHNQTTQQPGPARSLLAYNH